MHKRSPRDQPRNTFSRELMSRVILRQSPENVLQLARRNRQRDFFTIRFNVLTTRRDLDFKIGSDERKAPLLSADENVGQYW